MDASVSTRRIRFGDLDVDLGTQSVRLRDQPVSLTRSEFELLRLLISHPRAVVSDREILSSLWKVEWQEDAPAVQVYVSRLRRKLGESAQQPRYIRTVRGVGYYFDPAPFQTTDVAVDEVTLEWCVADARARHLIYFLVGTDRHIRWVSDTIAALLGWEPAQLIGTSIFDLLHPDARHETLKLSVREQLDARHSQRFRLPVRRNDGGYDDMQFTVRPIIGSDGFIAGFLSQWRSANPEVRDRDAAFESLPLGGPAQHVTLKYDADFILRSITPEVAVLGWEPAQILNTFFSPAGLDEAATRQVLQHYLASGIHTVEGPLLLHYADGSHASHDSVMRIQVDADGNFTGLVASFAIEG